MADYTVSSARNDLAGMLHGRSVNQVTNFYSLLWRAGRNVIAKIDPLETLRISEFSIYSDVFDYAPPDDLKKVADLRPQAGRVAQQNPTVLPLEQFDLQKETEDLAISLEYDDGVKILRVAEALSDNVLIHGMDGLTDNGTWAAGTGGSSVALDEDFKTHGGGSIRFSVSATGGAIENSTFTAVDLSDHQERSALFLRLYLPDPTIVTDVRLRWGSSSSAYWSRTVTTPHIGSFKTGWQWVRFDWNGATQSGTVDETAINYLLVTVTTNAADTDIRVDEIRSILPNVRELVYYSKYLFRTSAANWQEQVDAEANIVNLDTDARNIFLTEAAIMCLQQIGGSLSEIQTLKVELSDLYAGYRMAKPSEALRQVSTYYKVR